MGFPFLFMYNILSTMFLSLIHIYSGKVTLGGVNVKTVEPETLFKNFAIVFQDVLLLSLIHI